MSDRDPARELQRFNRPLPEPTADIPDDVLANTMIGYGFDPAETFVRFRYTMPAQYRWLRTLALKFYADVLAAGRGDSEAAERVDYCREVWQTMLRRKLSTVGMSGLTDAERAQIRHLKIRHG